MNTLNASQCQYSRAIHLAIENIRLQEMKKAYDFIMEAIQIDPGAAQPHNLLGIWYEIGGDKDKARRHYRAAYSLDPTFSPSCRNLERVCSWYDSMKCYAFDYGEEPQGK